MLEIFSALECSTPCVSSLAAQNIQYSVREAVPAWDFLCPTFACKYVGCYSDPVQNKGWDLHAKDMGANIPRRKGQKEIQREGLPFLSIRLRVSKKRPMQNRHGCISHTVPNHVCMEGDASRPRMKWLFWSFFMESFLVFSVGWKLVHVPKVIWPI